MSLASHRVARLATLVSSGLLALLGAASACDAPTAPLEFPARAIPWSPPAQYDLWWTLTEACAERQGDMREVQWYLWPDQGLIRYDGKSYNGYWWPTGSRIMLVSGFNNDGHVVRHEMLHQLLQLNGHPTEYFDQRCEGVVVGTDAPSTSGADPALVARARDVSPQMLTISLSTLPGRPRASVNAGWFVLDVQATNPSSDPIWVPLEPLEGEYKGFGYTISGGGRPARFEKGKEQRIFFGPGQRRHFYFDLNEPAPATFTVRGGIAGWYPATVDVVVDP